MWVKYPYIWQNLRGAEKVLVNSLLKRKSWSLSKQRKKDFLFFFYTQPRFSLRGNKSSFFLLPVFASKSLSGPKCTVTLLCRPHQKAFQSSLGSKVPVIRESKGKTLSKCTHPAKQVNGQTNNCTTCFLQPIINYCLVHSKASLPCCLFFLLVALSLNG